MYTYNCIELFSSLISYCFSIVDMFEKYVYAIFLSSTCYKISSFILLSDMFYFSYWLYIATFC